MNMYTVIIMKRCLMAFEFYNQPMNQAEEDLVVAVGHTKVN